MNENEMGTAVPPEAARVDTKQETDKKCPACGGVMDFSPTTGGLACPYCGHTQEITLADSEPSRAMEQDFASVEQTGNCDWGAEKKTVICKSCGAESVYDALQISNECPYCGSNQVMEEKGRDTLAPGGVCPFKIDIKQAGVRFKEWIRKKWFCPRVAKQKAKPSAFKGVYLPYWTFDTDTSSSYSGRYGIDRTVRDEDGKEHTETDWYSVSGQYSEFIDDHLVVGTTNHDAGMLSGLEPYDTANNLSYKPEYVAGFIAERYSIGIKDAWETAKKKIYSYIKRQVNDKVKRSYRADHVEINNLSVYYTNVMYKYLLLPVWLSSFKYKDKIYQFMVNGQTGKVSGKTPISPLRVLIAILLGLALIGILYLIITNS